MPDLSPLLQLVAMIITGGAIFGGIRATLAAIMRDVARIEKTAEQAHDRLTQHLEKHHAHV